MKRKKTNIRPSEQFQNLMTKSQKQANSKLLAHMATKEMKTTTKKKIHSILKWIETV
jgi:hypothetical protein